MAISNNPLLKGFSGHIDKVIVVKQNPGDRTVLTAYPDMSRVKPSKAQLAANSDFAKAVAYAKQVMSNDADKGEANVRLAKRKGSLYHALIKEFMGNLKPEIDETKVAPNGPVLYSHFGAPKHY